MDSDVRKIFLDENRHSNAQSKESTIDVDLTAKTVLLPDTNIQKQFSLFEQYNKERDNCTKYRFIISLNPICSNILFNYKTEVVKETESGYDRVPENGNYKVDGAINTSKLNRVQAIKDTEYSSKDVANLEYYCGFDIFNNHLLRTIDFTHVNKTNESNKDDFNTISDYRRDEDGKIVEENLNTKYTEKKKTPLHLYQYDTIDTFRNSYLNNIKEKDGWYGFYNKSTVEVPNTEDGKNFNKIISNKPTCDFINMYPGKDLYSFIPKYNNLKKRLEYNWDVFLTYAYASDTQSLNTLINNGENGNNGAIRCFIKESKNGNGSDIFKIRTLVPHTLKYNDRVRFYIGGTRLPFTVRVSSIGEIDGKNKEWVFSISPEAMLPYIDKIDSSGLFYKKVVDGLDCKYYFKKMKTLYSYDYVKNNSATDFKPYSVMPKADADSPNSIKVNDQKYTKRKKKLRIEVNKAAFAKNIYGDDISQIIVKDDVEIGGLKDNLGRSVSTVYLTIQKANRGYKEWYENDAITLNDTNIEQSHAFGKLTCGINMGTYDSLEGYSGKTESFTIRNYNTCYIHNIHHVDDNTMYCWSSDEDNLIVANTDAPKAFEVEHYYNNPDADFWGDLVEFCPSTYTETVIAPMMYRFNTAQRETVSEEYKNIYYDEIESDDYDVPVNGKGAEGFKIRQYRFNAITDSNGTESVIIYGNINPEGYCYKANLPITIQEESDYPTSVDGIMINFDTKKISVTNNTLTFTPPTKDHIFLKEDSVALYDRVNDSITWGSVTRVTESGEVTVLCDRNISLGDFTSRNVIVIASNEGVPTYAKYIPNSGKFVWRRLEKPSELPRDSELYDQTFANGCFYFEPVLNFFLKRQDPQGESGLGVPNGITIHPMENYIIRGQRKIDLSTVDFIMASLNRPCY